MGYLRTGDLEKQFGIPEATWRWWRHRGVGPNWFKLGRTVFYEAEEIANWVESQKAAIAKSDTQ